MSEVVHGYRRPGAATQPPLNSPAYGSTRARHPQQPLLELPHTLTETSSPVFTAIRYPETADLTVLDAPSYLHLLPGVDRLAPATRIPAVTA